MPGTQFTNYTSKLGEFLFQKNSRCLLIVNEAREIELSNPSAEILLAYDPGALNGLDFFMLFPISDRIIVQEIHERAFSSREEFEQIERLQILDSNDNDIQVLCTFSAIEIEEKRQLIVSIKLYQPKGTNGFELQRLNIELEKHIEERNRALKSSQELYRIVSRNFPNGVISVFDKNFNYLFAEGKELYNMGITSEKLVGTNYLERLPYSLHDEISDKLLEVLKGRNQTFEIAYKKNHYILNATGLENPQGDIDRILLVEINNTNQKRAEEEMKRAYEKERQLNELKSRFVSMASHEFRTPLSTILSSINLMMKYLDQPDGREKILKHGNKIKSSVKNLTAILNDFLSLDKLEEGKMEMHPSTFDLCELVRNLAEDLEELLKEGQEFQLVLPNEQEVYQDPNIFRNILLNLLTNAIKYSHENQEILVKVFQIGKHVYLEVQDQGIGIPEEEQIQMFERFFRAKNATNLQGTGLGLNIVKRYVSLIQGKISFISKEQEGTTFTVSFPKQFKHEENTGH
ncbi:MAG: ATP-binding protein [Luteibaculum sp.]